MAIIVEANPQVRRTVGSPNSEVELGYNVSGTDDEREAHAALADPKTGAPLIYDIFGNGIFYLPRQSITLVEDGPNNWKGTVHYSSIVPISGEIVFDTTGGSEHVDLSLETVDATGGAPNNHRLIGNDGDNVKGVTIVVPRLRYAERWILHQAALNQAIAAFYRLTGTVNASAFRNFDAGECLFMGASGNSRGDGTFELIYQFDASPNRRIAVEGLGSVEKGGFEYFWLRSRLEEDDSAKTMVRVAEGGYVERVYEDGDFSQLGIGTISLAIP